MLERPVAITFQARGLLASVLFSEFYFCSPVASNIQPPRRSTKKRQKQNKKVSTINRLKTPFVATIGRLLGIAMQQQERCDIATVLCHFSFSEKRDTPLRCLRSANLFVLRKKCLSVSFCPFLSQMRLKSLERLLKARDRIPENSCDICRELIGPPIFPCQCFLNQKKTEGRWSRNPSSP